MTNPQTAFYILSEPPRHSAEMNPKITLPLLLLIMAKICSTSLSTSPTTTEDNLVRRHLLPQNWPSQQPRHFKIFRPTNTPNSLTSKDYKNLKRTNHFTVTPMERTSSGNSCSCGRNQPTSPKPSSSFRTISRGRSIPSKTQ